MNQGRRNVRKSEGGLYYCGGYNLSPLVEIGLTVLPKTRGAQASPPACDSPVNVYESHDFTQIQSQTLIIILQATKI